MKKIQIEDLRSRKWFMNADNREMTALYLERYLNYGLTRKELQSGKPIIGIAQTGSDLSPCNRHHLELTKRVRDGIIAAGGTPIEIPVHPIQETGKRPTAMLDRNLAYLSLVETLFGYPLDGVVLNIGCDKTTPALLMAAATVNIPAIALSVGPMLNGWFNGERTVWPQLNAVFAQRLAMGFYLAPTMQPRVKTDRTRLQVFLQPIGQARFGPVNGCKSGVCLHFHLNPVAPVYEYTCHIR